MTGDENVDVDAIRDAQLGTAVKLLESRDKSKAVGYLLGADSIRLTYDNTDWGIDYFDLIMAVEIERFDDFSDTKVHDDIRDAFKVVMAARDEAVSGILLEPKLVASNWRELRQQMQAPPVTNQATLAALPPKHPVMDGLNFRDHAEVMMYKALKHVQAELLPSSGTIGIIPNCALRVKDYTWEPDFVVTYQGRVGVIEVDGRTHIRKRAADTSREVLLRKSGVKVVLRIDAADAEKPAEALQLAKDLVDELKVIR